MKLFLFNWLQPLQPRTKEKVVTQESPFMKIWDVIYPVLLYYVACSLFLIFASFLLRWLLGLEGMKDTLTPVYEQFQRPIHAVLNSISLLVGAGTVYSSFKEEKLRMTMPNGHKKDVGVIFVAGATMALCVNILFSLLQITGSSQAYEKVAERQFSLPLWLGIILYGLISPLAEEMVFRGLVYNRLYRNFGMSVALIGSSLLFGVYHGNFVQALYGFILGFFIAVLYERYGSFFVPFLAHGAANICVYVIADNALWQQNVMKWSVCIVIGALALILTVWMLGKKKSIV